MRECPNKFADFPVAVRNVIIIFGGVWADVGTQYSPPSESLVKALFMLGSISNTRWTI